MVWKQLFITVTFHIDSALSFLVFLGPTIAMNVLPESNNMLLTAHQLQACLVVFSTTFSVFGRL